ncbi:MAG: MFS transporter, partial [Promethearchaeota archaeon]
NFVTFLLLILINEPLIAVIGLGIGTFFGGYGIFNTTLMYLSIDEDELKNGSRREGMFLGVNALVHKPAQSIGPIIATLILSSFGFIQGSDTQPQSAIAGVLILMFLIPAIFSLIGLVFMYFYSYNKEKVEEMHVKLKQLHTEKKKKLN